MMSPSKVVLAGIGGYGMLYVNEFLDHPDASAFVLEGVVDPLAENCTRLCELLDRRIPAYRTLEAYYAEHSADLAILSTPIQYHAENTCTALLHGSHVLCEKPVAATLDDLKRMIAARDAAGRMVAIGYQWSFSRAVLDLKRDILSGRFGKPLRMKTIVLWPRDWKYYSRGWAGKKKDREGRWILDSVAANATAHYLHNMLFVLGDAIDRSAVPMLLQAETYRANAIENYDTAALRVWDTKGTEMLFLVSHAIEPESVRNPEFTYLFERAEIRYQSSQDESSATIQAILEDGSVIDYGNPYEDEIRKFKTTLDAIRSGSELPCGLEAASAHAVCMAAVQESVPDAIVFPESMIIRSGERQATWVPGLAGIMNRCYGEWKLPHELGASWALRGKTVHI